MKAPFHKMTASVSWDLSHSERRALRQMTARVQYIASGYRRAQIAYVARETNLLALLAEPRAPGELADQLGWSPRGTRILLDGLVALGMVARTEGKCATAPGRDTFTPEAQKRALWHGLNLLRANESGIFPYLEESRAPADVAQFLGASPRGARRLLEGLAESELIVEDGGKFTNAPAASACLVPGRPGSQTEILRYNLRNWETWARLEDAVREGKPVGRLPAEKNTNPEERRDYILGMSNLGLLDALEMRDELDLSNRRRLLDLCGGPGVYTIPFLRKYPEMRATLFDLEPVAEIAREQFRQAGLERRAQCVAGDLNDPAGYGSGHDVVLVSNIIHLLGPQAALRCLEKCHEALVPGGLLIVKDFLVDDDRSGPAFSLLFAVNMLAGTLQGDTYTISEVRSWVERAGFTGGRLVDFRPENRLWIAEKPLR